MELQALFRRESAAEPYGVILMIYRENFAKIPVWKKIRQSITQLI
jgi:hypothetical protein